MVDFLEVYEDEVKLQESVGVVVNLTWSNPIRTSLSMPPCDSRTNSGSDPVCLFCIDDCGRLSLSCTDTVELAISLRPHRRSSKELRISLHLRKTGWRLQDTTCALNHSALLRQRPLLIDKMDFIPRTDTNLTLLYFWFKTNKKQNTSFPSPNTQQSKTSHQHP